MARPVTFMMPPPCFILSQMCEMVECLSRRTWLTDNQLCAVLDAFSDEVGVVPVAFRVRKGWLLQ